MTCPYLEIDYEGEKYCAFIGVYSYHPESCPLNEDCELFREQDFEKDEEN